jgi:hypothetical protein
VLQLVFFLYQTQYFDLFEEELASLLGILERVVKSEIVLKKIQMLLKILNCLQRRSKEFASSQFSNGQNHQNSDRKTLDLTTCRNLGAIDLRHAVT